MLVIRGGLKIKNSLCLNFDRFKEVRYPTSNSLYLGTGMVPMNVMKSKVPECFFIVTIFTLRFFH
jgi:hypothetical protein